MQPLLSDKRAFSSHKLPKLTDLPIDVLRRITLYVMDAHQSSHSDSEANPFLNASHPAFLRNGIRLAVTCRLMLHVFHDALTAIKLVSSWQTSQNTLTAACRIASNNLRALHVECSAPVTGALREVICMRPPIRHFVLIGVNISKQLMADIVFFVGHTVRKLVISAAPSLDDCIVDLISAKCANLQYLELGGSRRVTNESLLNLFDNIGHGLRGIELNALQHDSLDERILLNVAHRCSNLTAIRMLKLRWVTDPSLEHFFKLRAHQLTEVRIEACRQVSYHSLCLLKRLGTSLESLTCTFTNYEWMSIHTPDLIGIHNAECGERCRTVYKRDMNFCLGENALTIRPHILSNLRELRLTDSVITDEIANRLLCSLHNLENLTLRHCTSLGDLSLQSIAGNATGLKYLDISYLPLITDAGVEFLLSALRTGLHEVRILGCTSLTDRTATDILPSCGMQLKMVRLSYCLFSRQAISKLKESLPRTTLCGSSGCTFQ